MRNAFAASLLALCVILPMSGCSSAPAPSAPSTPAPPPPPPDPRTDWVRVWPEPRYDGTWKRCDGVKMIYRYDGYEGDSVAVSPIVPDPECLPG